MLLEARNVTVYYGTILALDNISFNVNEGEIVSLLGSNGAGKSTTLKAICGFAAPQTGEIMFQGENIRGRRAYQLVRKGLCLVPEGRRVFSSMTVLENLEMGAFTLNNSQLFRLGKSDGTGTDIKQLVGQVLELFPTLKERLKHRAGTLSGGEQQVLAIARALMLKPKLLMLDEPSLGLSPNYMDILFGKLAEINRQGTTVLLVEQNARMALEISHRAYIFQTGKIFKEDTGANLLNDSEVKTAFLGL